MNSEYQAIVKRGLLALIALLAGCNQVPLDTTIEISSFIDTLKAEGVEGKLDLDFPANDEIEYIATYVISVYTSTRILSFFKCSDVEKAQHSLEKTMKNPKLTGQARNGTMIMAATFFPPDEAAVVKIKELFLAHNFDAPL